MDSIIMCKIIHLLKIHGQTLTEHENEYLAEFEVKTNNLLMACQTLLNLKLLLMQSNKLKLTLE